MSKRAKPVDEAFEDDGDYDNDSEAGSGSDAESIEEDIDERRIRLSKQYIAELEGDDEQKKKRLKLDIDEKKKKVHRSIAREVKFLLDEEVVSSDGKDCES